MAETKILIVEDDRIVAEDMRCSLKQLGFAVPGLVSSGEEAIEKAKECDPDLVLMDIMLKGEMNGIEAAGRIQSQFNIPVVYHTAYADEEILERIKVIEPFGYILKPFEDRELNIAIEIALYKHKMEKKLRDSEQWLSAALKSIGDVLIATDREGLVTFINPVAEAMTGWTQEEATGKPLGDMFQIINEDTGNDVESPVVKVLRDGEVVGPANDMLLVAGNGKEISINYKGSPIRDEHGNIIGVVLIFRDVREKRQTEVILQKETNELKKRVKELNCVYSISKLIEMPELSLDKIMQSAVDLIPPSWQYPDVACARLILNKKEYKTDNFKETLLKQVSDIFAGGDKIGSLEVVYLEQRPECYEGPFLKEERNLIDSIAELLGRLIARTEAVRALKESEKKYKTLYADAGDALFILEVDPENMAWCIECNQRTLRLFGCERSDIIGKTSDLISPEIQPDGISSREKAFELTKLVMKGHSQSFLWLHHRFDNQKPFWVEVNLSSLTLGGKSNYMQAVVRDISERKKAEKENEELQAQLIQSHKMEAIGTLAGGIAHEFNNLLGIIVGNTELAMDEVPEWNSAHYNLEEIRTACLRARDVVKQILAFSRQTKQELKPVNISQLIDESIKFIRSSMPSSIEIKKNISIKLDTINADSTQINQILLNLCSNAAHAMQDNGGILEINLENIKLDGDGVKVYDGLKSGNYAKLTVRDTGHGIDQGNIEHIFDPFFTTKEVGEGSGMGLSVVHGIVKDHDGNITVQSKAGKGTAFYVLFPVIEGSVKPEIESEGPLLKGSERILFVDDEESLVFSARRMLGKLGYDVIAKRNPIKALEIFKEQPETFDLVITDMTMPKMTGDRLAKEIMKIRPNIPLILSTGFSELISEEQAKEMGISTFVMKPYLVREMAKTIRRVLDPVKEEVFPATRILVVDDEKQMRSMLRQTLEISGYEVSEAPDSNVALWIFKEKPSDLIITQEKEGLEIIMELRQDFPDVKIIAIAGGGQGDSGQFLNMAKKIPADSILVKPFEMDELLKSVKEILTVS